MNDAWIFIVVAVAAYSTITTLASVSASEFAVCVRVCVSGSIDTAGAVHVFSVIGLIWQVQKISIIFRIESESVSERRPLALTPSPPTLSSIHSLSRNSFILFCVRHYMPPATTPPPSSAFVLI